MSFADLSKTPTRHAEVAGRKIAYRTFGTGLPLVLALRFRGVMDVWDPLFLDRLAEEFQVVIFDYTGLGLSSGTPTYDRASLATDIRDLIDHLGFDRIVVGGWSLGGVVAQTFTVLHPDRVLQTVLIGTAPPGLPAKSGEPLFMQTAMHPVNTLEDEYILFFEPASETSKAAAAASHERIAARAGDRSPPVPEAVFLKLLSEGKDRRTIYPDPDNAHEAHLAGGPVPILVVSGDHDIACPVENWLPRVGAWKSLHLVTIPQAGHGPQHQEPLFVADLIAAFVKRHSDGERRDIQAESA